MRLFGNIEVDARPITGALFIQIAVSVFHGFDTNFHIENLLNVFVGQKNHSRGSVREHSAARR
jgi:hypothetical protein